MKKAKLFSVILVLLLVFNTVLSAGTVNGRNLSMQEISRLTGFTVEDLERYKDSLGDQFNVEVERLISYSQEYNNSINRNDWFRGNDYSLNSGKGRGMGKKTKIPFLIENYARVGDIHVTAQSQTYGFRHGHAALALNNKINLETYGGNDLSGIKYVSNWQNYKNYALLRIKATSAKYEKRVIVADYAKKHLQGLKYNALSATNSKTVNCASLVTKAYKESGVLDMYPWQGNLTVLPIDLVRSIHTYKVITHDFPW